MRPAMETAEQSTAGEQLGEVPIHAVVCGTFRRDLDRLSLDYDELTRAGCRVLSPLDVEFVSERDGFVFAAHERDQSPETIEAGHLRAIALADFVWLHAPGGYVGVAAAMELGFAHSLGVPVFGRTMPADVTLSSLTQMTDSPSSAAAAIRMVQRRPPVRSLSSLQAYYSRIALERGYSAETPQECMLLLTEEVGELARAVRKHVGLAREGGYSDEDPANELADIQLYLVHLANVLNVDLAAAVDGKEQHNADRFSAQGIKRSA